MVGGLISTALTSGLETVSGNGLITSALCTEKNTKTKKITVNVYCALHNYFNANTQQFMDIVTASNFHFVLLNTNNNVIYNSVVLSTAFKSSYVVELDVPDKEIEYDYTLKAKVVAGFDVDDDFYFYTIQVKPVYTTYRINIGHNLCTHIYRFNSKIYDDMLPLDTVKYGDVNGCNIEGYQTERLELLGYCHSIAENKKIYQNNNYQPNGLLYCYVNALNAIGNSTYAVRGVAFSFRKDVPAGVTNAYTTTGGLRYTPATFRLMCKGNEDIFRIQREKKSQGTLVSGGQITTGFFTEDGTRDTNFFNGESYNNSNSVLATNYNTILNKIKTEAEIQNELPLIMSNMEEIIESNGQDKKWFGVNYVTVNTGAINNTYKISFDANKTLEDFDLSSKETEYTKVLDYWEVKDYQITLAPKYKTDEMLYALSLIKNGEIHSAGNMYSFIVYDGKNNILNKTKNCIIQKNASERDTYIADFGTYISKDFEYWLE